MYEQKESFLSFKVQQGRVFFLIPSAQPAIPACMIAERLTGENTRWKFIDPTKRLRVFTQETYLHKLEENVGLSYPSMADQVRDGKSFGQGTLDALHTSLDVHFGNHDSAQINGQLTLTVPHLHKLYISNIVSSFIYSIHVVQNQKSKHLAFQDPARTTKIYRYGAWEKISDINKELPTSQGLAEMVLKGQPLNQRCLEALCN